MTATTDLPMMCVSFLGEAEIARRVYHTVAARRNACADHKTDAYRTFGSDLI